MLAPDLPGHGLSAGKAPPASKHLPTGCWPLQTRCSLCSSQSPVTPWDHWRRGTHGHRRRTHHTSHAARKRRPDAGLCRIARQRTHEPRRCLPHGHDVVAHARLLPNGAADTVSGAQERHLPSCAGTVPRSPATWPAAISMEMDSSRRRRCLCPTLLLLGRRDRMTPLRAANRCRTRCATPVAWKSQIAGTR